MTQTKKSLSEKRRLAAAYREAGHAIMAWQSGILLESISIHSRTRQTKENAWNNPLAAIDPDWIREEHPELLIERLALVCLAGPAAERRFSPRGSREPIFKERLRDADTLLKCLPDSSEKRDRQRRKLSAKAARLMKRRDLWKKTERLAEALTQRGTISGKEAMKIIEKET